MDLDTYRDFCLSFKGVEEVMPFDEVTLVYKVKGKIFTATNIELFERINVKCDPEKAIELREQYAEVIPGYHMSKKHWNTVYVNQSLSQQQIKDWIQDSYNLVVKGLTKKLQKELKEES